MTDKRHEGDFKQCQDLIQKGYPAQQVLHPGQYALPTTALLIELHHTIEP